MINWRLRLQNKTTLLALAASVISLFYMVLGVFKVTPNVSQEYVLDIAKLIVNIFVIMGIVVDPTTKGIKDSEQALDYDRPAENTKIYR